VIESYQIEIVNRLFVGPAFGWSVYLRDDENDMGEVILYLGLISINIKYNMGGLKVEDGRLINEDPSPQIGIQKVVREAGRLNATKLSTLRNIARDTKMNMLSDMMRGM